MNNEIRNVIIIGSGPAGLTAAIYASRADMKPLVIEGQQPGGQLTITTEVDNYPGFPDGINGPELVMDMHKQAERFGTEFISDVVTSVDLSKRPFVVRIGDVSYKSKTLIISTGASAKWLGIESEKKLMGSGVSGCATCDGFFFKGKEVVVAGGGDTAVEEAIFLTKFATKVSIIHRRNQLRASRIMQEKVLKNEKISFIWDSVVDKILGEDVGHVTGVRIKNVKSGSITDFHCNGVFIAIGHTPNTKIFEGLLELDEKGYIILKQRTYTSVEGVFAAGDVADPVYRQAVTAAGMGCMAAIDAERFLEG
ncbi:MAG: thioredoxin-disulfide reductase [Nitrospirae bacterium RIFCSPHIGHO2_02_FULL_42_12]|nr:MAG: thioredoxin-disulfide reductase [Nitrospirae bacterium RIFCSPHIGHO2_02_FULL_42_12]